MVGIFSFTNNLLIIPAAWSWAAAWNQNQFFLLAPTPGVIPEGRGSQHTRVSPESTAGVDGTPRAGCSEPTSRREGGTWGSNWAKEDKEEEEERCAPYFLWFSPFELKIRTEEGSMETLLFVPSFLFLGKLDGRLSPCLCHPCPAEQPEGH